MRNRVGVQVVSALALMSSFISVNAQQVGSETQAQISRSTPAAATAPTVIPALVPFSGVAVSGDGKPLTGERSVTFLIFKEEEGGEALWVETQNVASDVAGHYKVQLGAANPNGLPSTLFATGEARWLEIQTAGESPQPRLLLASVPYALKAADAATLGGLPASAFALAGSNVGVASVSSSPVTEATSSVTTTGGTANKLAKFSGTSTIVNSTVYDNGTDVGIGTTAPTATLTVDGTFTLNGSSTLNGQAAFPAQGTATSTKAYDSQSLKFSTSAYNSSTKAVVPPRFQLQAEPTGSDTSAPAGTLNVLASTTSASPTETGLYFNTNGTIHFASGQTFPATSSGGTAVDGTSTSGIGVEGSSSSSFGVQGNSSTGTGVQGKSSSSYGVEGTSTSGPGVLGYTSGSTLNTAGVIGQAGGTSGYSGIAGVWGDSSTHVGVYGSSVPYAGVFGQSTSGNGVQGSSSSANGVYGFSSMTSAVHGETQSTSAGDAAVYGGSDTIATGVIGISNSGIGGDFYGGLQSNGDGSFGIRGTGASSSSGNNFGGTGGGFYGGTGGDYLGGDGLEGIGGPSTGNSGAGMVGDGGTSNGGTPGDGGIFIGGYGPNGTGGDGVHGIQGEGNTLGYAGSFAGDVNVSGTLSADAKDFKIDHPSDPANKYLVHASVESSEMMNIYSGNVTTDENGQATVTLPTWFQALNTDFRYQLTVVGGRFAQAIVSKEISGNQFTIMTNASAVKVSWQVTAVRQDAYAVAHPLVVEETKSARERGFYKHPELYGQPAEKQTDWALHPEMMLHVKAIVNGAKNPAKTTSAGVRSALPVVEAGHSEVK